MGLTERPKCANPDCNEGAIIFKGRLAFCGGCLLKLQAIEQKEEQEQMLEKLKNAKNAMPEM